MQIVGCVDAIVLQVMMNKDKDKDKDKDKSSRFIQR